MKFANPYLLNLLWMLILVAFFLIYGILRRQKILDSFCSREMLGKIFPGFNPKKRWVKAVLTVLAAAFAIIAMAGPQMGFKWEKVKQKGVDIMIALDCSKSMLAQDIKPNRLERAKREIIDLLQMMRSDRAGLVAFSGNAILQCPLTMDHQAFHIFLDVLEPGFLPTGGTNLDAAVQTCLTGFEKDSDTQKAIILITDGESTSGNVEKTMAELSKKGIKLFCIGVGGVQGAPIPDDSGGFKKDRAGTIILSKVDETGLEKLAAMTGGAYVRSVAGDMDLDVIYADHILGTMERKTLVSGKKKVWENRFQWFLFPCIVLMLIEFLLLPAKGKKKDMLIGIIVFLLVFSGHDQHSYAESVFSSVKKGIEAYDKNEYDKAKKYFIDAQLEDPDEAKLYYNIGTAAYMNNEYEQAKKNFLQAVNSEDKVLRRDARFNLANSEYKLGNLDEAIERYEQVLKEFPDDEKARENLEFVKKKKQEQKQNSQDQKNDKSEQSQENKDQENKDQKNKDQKNKDQENRENNQDQNGQQDQNNQGKPDKSDKQDKQKRSKKDESQDQGKQQKSDNRQDQGMNKSSDAQNKKTEQEPPPSKQEKGPAQNRGQDKSKVPESVKNQNIDKMLNRLDDKPGKAMMPAYRGRHVEKDW